jgi:hypothetical protein
VRSILESILQATRADDRDRAERILRVMDEYRTRFMRIADPEAGEIAALLAYTVGDLRNVANELIREATPETAGELEKLLSGFARRAAKKVGPSVKRTS